MPEPIYKKSTDGGQTWVTEPPRQSTLQIAMEVVLSKTFLAGAGLIGLAVYQYSQGQTDAACQSALAALAAWGLRHAIAKQGDK